VFSIDPLMGCDHGTNHVNGLIN